MTSGRLHFRNATAVYNTPPGFTPANWSIVGDPADVYETADGDSGDGTYTTQEHVWDGPGLSTSTTVTISDTAVDVDVLEAHGDPSLDLSSAVAHFRYQTTGDPSIRRNLTVQTGYFTFSVPLITDGAQHSVEIELVDYSDGFGGTLGSRLYLWLSDYYPPGSPSHNRTVLDDQNIDNGEITGATTYDLLIYQAWVDFVTAEAVVVAPVRHEQPPVVRQYPRDDRYGAVGSQRVYPPPRQGRVFGGQG